MNTVPRFVQETESPKEFSLRQTLNVVSIQHYIRCPV